MQPANDLFRRLPPHTELVNEDSESFQTCEKKFSGFQDALFYTKVSSGEGSTDWTIVGAGVLAHV
jgi:hypothetical protein